MMLLRLTNIPEKLFDAKLGWASEGNQTKSIFSFWRMSDCLLLPCLPFLSIVNFYVGLFLGND